MSKPIHFDARFHRPWIWWYLGPCVGLWISTRHLGYHFANDVVCGFALAALGLAIAFHRPRQSESADSVLD